MTHLLALAVLIGIFAVGTARSVNLGLLSFVGSFAVGTWVFEAEVEQLLAGFPANLFVILVGVTYLFAIAKRNGTIDWLIEGAVRSVGGSVAALPWVVFALSAVLVGLGALSPAAVAVIAPVALAFAVRYGINPLLMGLMVIHGSAAGNFSPLGVLGVITNGLVESAGIPGNPKVVFVSNLVFNIVLAAVVYAAFGGVELLRSRGRSGPVSTITDEDVLGSGGSGGAVQPSSGRHAGGAVVAPAVEVGARARRDRIVTLSGMVILAVGSLAFDLDIGLSAMTVASILALMSPDVAKSALGDVSWGIVLLISGIVTYVGLLESQGTIDYLGREIADVPLPVLAALVLLFVAAFVSAFASTTGILGALIPLSVPLLAAGDLGPVALVAALSISASVVDTSPFSTNGALVVANTPEAESARVYRGLMTWGFGLVLVAPVVTWAIFVVPGW
ncbi:MULTISPECIES: SLC13 family permease [Nocardioides]|uniref:SLC13 family permease n=1 Tax=Nocardioides vastitatis TaxID=2568655 RepID=A0ABW0ZDI0_9ACTN|nr:SLC13 family permease [Nocardioides sp.]THI96860.1 hypothetical protein E7Z54_15225 [Nocardioides sp.]